MSSSPRLQVPILILQLTVSVNYVGCQQVKGRQCDLGEYSVVRGECKNLIDCPMALSNLRAGINPTKCYHEDEEGIVCCPIEKRISARKCEEYSKQISMYSMTSFISRLGFGSGGSFGNSNSNIAGGRSASLQTVGGSDASEMPFTVALGTEEPEKPISWKCGGTLVSDQFILTAAHCLDGKASSPPNRVLLGDIHLQQEDSDKRIKAQVEKVYIHPEYQRPAKYNDIGLLKLDRKVKFSGMIQPACLPRPDIRPESIKEFRTAGWGRLGFGENASTVLQIANLTRFSANECNAVYSNRESINELPQGIIKSQICAGDPEASKDTCDGDSGGPLSAMQDSNDYVIGITSFGDAFCGYGSPGVYTNVLSYLDWIEGIVWEQEYKKSVTNQKLKKSATNQQSKNATVGSYCILLTNVIFIYLFMLLCE